MKIKENVSLAKYTTFKIGGPARFFCAVNKDAELLEAVEFAKKNNLAVLVLGGGSNILVSDKGFPGLVIKNEYMGVSMEGTRVYAAAGELWDELVEKTVLLGLSGLENLSAIPGTVGATPIQNIGAYGTDVSKFIVSVRVFDLSDMSFKVLSNAQCKFEYRESMFKQPEIKNRYFVTHVEYKLQDDGSVNTEYKDIKDYFKRKGIKSPMAKDVRQAVIDVRWGKLPDWKLWGTAGSFFKNPVISLKQFNELKAKYPELPSFPDETDKNKVKVSLAWILDKICNAKDESVGKVSVFEKQALVFVARPGATAKEVVELSHRLMLMVKEKTGIDIEAEVEWVN